MPTFTDTLSRAELGGLLDNPRIAHGWGEGLHFVNHLRGQSLGEPFGALLRGYGDIGLPGHTAEIVNTDTVDNLSAIATPTIVGLNPNPRTVQIHFQAGNAAHRAIARAGADELLEFRHIGPPPDMDLTHSVDMLSQFAPGTVNRAQGNIATAQATPVAPPVTLAGLYFSSSTYTLAELGTGVRLDRTKGDQHLDGAADNNPNLNALSIDMDTTANTFSITSSIVGASLPAGWKRRALIYLPGIGYAFSNDAAASINNTSAAVDTTFMSLAWDADANLVDAVQAATSLPAIHLAIWQWDDRRKAL